MRSFFALISVPLIFILSCVTPRSWTQRWADWVGRVLWDDNT